MYINYRSMEKDVDLCVYIYMCVSMEKDVDLCVCVYIYMSMEKDVDLCIHRSMEKDMY